VGEDRPVGDRREGGRGKDKTGGSSDSLPLGDGRP